MSGIPGIGLTNPIALGLLSCAIAVENFARRWNRQPTVPPNYPVRHPTRSVFPKINDRDAAMGFAPDSAIAPALAHAIDSHVKERVADSKRPGL